MEDILRIKVFMDQNEKNKKGSIAIKIRNFSAKATLTPPVNPKIRSNSGGGRMSRYNTDLLKFGATSSMALNTTQHQEQGICFLA
jgi:hypothetical protein